MECDGFGAVSDWSVAGMFDSGWLSICDFDYIYDCFYKEEVFYELVGCSIGPIIRDKIIIANLENPQEP